MIGYGDAPVWEALKEVKDPELGVNIVDLGLVFGAIDLRLGVDGRYYFLEVNPAGQFVYLELKTGLPLIAALASVLARGRSLVPP